MSNGTRPPSNSSCNHVDAVEALLFVAVIGRVALTHDHVQEWDCGDNRSFGCITKCRVLERVSVQAQTGNASIGNEYR